MRPPRSSSHWRTTSTTTATVPTVIRRRRSSRSATNCRRTSVLELTGVFVPVRACLDIRIEPSVTCHEPGRHKETRRHTGTRPASIGGQSPPAHVDRSGTGAVRQHLFTRRAGRGCRRPRPHPAIAPLAMQLHRCAQDRGTGTASTGTIRASVQTVRVDARRFHPCWSRGNLCVPLLRPGLPSNTSSSETARMRFPAHHAGGEACLKAWSPGAGKPRPACRASGWAESWLEG